MNCKILLPIEAFEFQPFNMVSTLIFALSLPGSSGQVQLPAVSLTGLGVLTFG